MRWSFSSKEKFSTCARMYYLQYVTKQISSLPTEQTIYGTRVHEALELRVKIGKALPEDLKHLENLCVSIVAMGGKNKVYTEFEMALNEKLEPVAMDASDVWVRGVADVLVVGERRIVVLDWKTGKEKPASEQLALMTAMAFAHFPGRVSCKTGFVWLKTGNVTAQTFLASEVHKIWQDIMPGVVRMENAYKQGKWIPRPSGLCAGWCNAGSGLCEFWSPKKEKR